MSKRKHAYDVIIVGGGLAGLSLSSLLGQISPSLKIACIDAAPATATSDLRTTAISYGSAKILTDAGVWERMKGKTSAIDDIEILDGHSSVLLNFLKTEVENKSFGWIVDNAELREALLATLKKLKNVTHITEAEVKGFNVDDEYASCTIGTKTLTAKLIIGADGRNSATRDFMGVRTRRVDYHQRAVICTASHEHPHNNIAVEHFWPEGPFAILPMADDKKGTHRSSVVFTEHGDEKNSLMRLSDSEFETALAARFPERYGDIKLVGKRVAYPLSLVHATDYIAPRMVLVADAAHGIHPIAGQGLNLGFRDIAELANLIAQAHANGKDIGADELLQTYQRRRRPDNMAMIAATDGLNRLFSNNITPVRLLRRVGLKAVAKLKPAKRFFMRQAMGDR